MLSISTRELVIPYLSDVLHPALLLWGALGLAGFFRRFPYGYLSLGCATAAVLTLDLLLLPLEAGARAPVSILAGLVLLGALLLAGKMIPKPRPVLLTAVLATGWTVFCLHLAVTEFVLLRNIPRGLEFFTRLSGATAVLLVLYFVLLKRESPGIRRSLWTGSCILFILGFSARTAIWWRAVSPAIRGQWEAGSPLHGLRGGFHRLQALHHLARADSHLPGDYPAALEELRSAAGRVGPRWIANRGKAWMSHAGPFLFLAAFGGKLPSSLPGNPACLLLDETVPTFLIGTTEGMVYDVSAPDAPRDLGFEPIDACPATGGSVGAFLSRKGELVISGPTHTPSVPFLFPPGEYAAIASGGTPGMLSVLRSDGARFRFQDWKVQVETEPVWPGEDLAAGLAVVGEGSGEYILDVFGGIHPRGLARITYSHLEGHSGSVHYWPGQRIAREIALSGTGDPVYLDAYGGVHFVRLENGKVLLAGSTRPRLEDPVAVDFVVAPSYNSIYVLTSNGRILEIRHPQKAIGS